MDMPTSVSELLVLKNLAEHLGFKTLDEAEIQVEKWFKNINGKSVNFNTLIKEASKRGEYEIPKGSLKRVIEFAKAQPEFGEMMYRDLNLNLSMALGTPIQGMNPLVFGELALHYSRIQAAISPDLLLRLVYVGKGENSARDAQQVTLSMHELGVTPKPYTLNWDTWSNVLLHAKSTQLGSWPAQYAELIAHLTNEVENDFIKDDPCLLGLIDPDGKEHILIAFGSEPGTLHVAKKQGEEVVSYTESFDAVQPVLVRSNSNGLYDKIVGLESRLALEVPHDIEERAPYLYFEMDRNGETVRIESDDIMSFNLAILDENRQQPVSSSFYYGIEPRAASAIWQLNQYVALCAKVDQDDGYSLQEIRSKAVNLLYSELKSRFGCDEILTPKPEFEIEDKEAPPAP